MCCFKSMLLLKDRVFIPCYDSHEDMIEACGLDHGPMRENFVRVEITPPDDDLTVTLDEWSYCVDQDYLPDWYVEEVDKKRCFDALKTWAIKHILIGKSIEKLTAEDESVILINSTIKVLDGGTVREVLGGGTVWEVWNGGTVQKVLDGGTVREVWGGGTVQKVLTGGTVREVLGGGTVWEVWGGGTVPRQCGGIVIYSNGKISVCDKNFYHLVYANDKNSEEK